MEFLKGLWQTKLFVIALSVLLLLSMVGFLIMRFTAPVLVPLYSDLNIEDSSLIVSKVQAMGIRYESSEDGKRILVPSEKVFQLRMNFAEQGIPSSGNIVGYEIFDKSEPMGASQFIQNVNLVRALEGELGRTISSINTIESARVHLVIPKREMFSKNAAEPSSSVVLKIKGGQMLSKSEIAAVGYLVANAVPGLRIENVAIVDTMGRPLKLGGVDSEGMGDVTANATEFQLSLERKLEVQITDLVERYVGVGRAKTNVTAEIDFNKEIVNKEIFDPNGQVVRSRKVSEESDKEGNGSNAGNALSVSTNVQNTASQGGGSKDKSRTDEVTNYEISRTVTNKIIEGGSIKKLSIAIVIDGTYELDQEKNTMEYKERTPEELNKLKNLIMSAVGFDPKRGDVIEIENLKFATEFAMLPSKEGMFDWIKDDLQNLVQTCIVGVVLILIILLVIRPLAMKSIEMIKERQEYERELKEVAAQEQIVKEREAAERQREAQIALEIANVEENKKATTMKQLNEIIEQSPEEAVAMIRNWLYQD